ncbi:migration and invasion-inhibitory protein isoform X2 [Hemicordylus capensis]|uniref:migration and invasion-inhibitory protein isoform X2 n=1 Tax=Hemicordylus capensis TaxID=884348 RepID=UPI0023042A8C|nr:migration and invasion-inhibitory protein isoform X2 [Hemicordylus capensis]
MDRENLVRLRRMNQALLQRLRLNQEELKRRTPIKSAPLSLSKQAVAKNGENQGQLATSKATTRPAEAVGPWVARSGLGCTPKPTMIRDEPERETSLQRHPSSDSPAAEVPSAAEARVAEESFKPGGDGSFPRGLQKASAPVSHKEAKKHLTYLHGVSEKNRPRFGAELGQEQAKGSSRPRTSSARVLQTPKSILLTPQAKETKEKTKKEAGRVTFMSNPEEYTIPADDWSARPFLGYDWIAGLLDTDSSVSEKPDQYFSELQDFRRVNRDACIYDRRARSEASGSSTFEQGLGADLVPHQCIFCYRLNKRLFAVPVDSEAACPVCKTPRTQKPLETSVEPAFVRVSIPRSTLLPAYKHKIHRRKSYEPEDNLALPSHCLAGWDKTGQAFSPTLSSLDLRSSLAASKTSGHLDGNLRSRVSGGTKTNELLNLSRTTEFELSNVSRLWDHHKAPCCKATSN